MKVRPRLSTQAWTAKPKPKRFPVTLRMNATGRPICPACQAARRPKSLSHIRRGYAAVATSPVLSPDVLELTLSPPISNPPSLPVEGSSRVSRILEETRALLEDEIGGSEYWTQRVKHAVKDIAIQRRAVLAGLFSLSISVED